MTQQNDSFKIQSLQEQLIDLECKLSFQEDTIEQLNLVIVKQQKQIDKALQLVTKLQSQIISIQENVNESTQPDPPPPHY